MKITTSGIDVAKSVFQVHGVDALLGDNLVVVHMRANPKPVDAVVNRHSEGSVVQPDPD